MSYTSGISAPQLVVSQWGWGQQKAVRDRLQPVPYNPSRPYIAAACSSSVSTPTLGIRVVNPIHVQTTRFPLRAAFAYAPLKTDRPLVPKAIELSRYFFSSYPCFPNQLR